MGDSVGLFVGESVGLSVTSQTVLSCGVTFVTCGVASLTVTLGEVTVGVIDDDEMLEVISITVGVTKVPHPVPSLAIFVIKKSQVPAP